MRCDPSQLVSFTKNEVREPFRSHLATFTDPSSTPAALKPIEKSFHSAFTVLNSVKGDLHSAFTILHLVKATLHSVKGNLHSALTVLHSVRETCIRSWPFCVR